MPGLAVTASDPSCTLPPVLSEPSHDREPEGHVHSEPRLDVGARIIYDLVEKQYRFEDRHRKPIPINVIPSLNRAIHFAERTAIQIVAALIAASHGFDIEDLNDAFTMNANLWVFRVVRRRPR